VVSAEKGILFSKEIPAQKILWIKVWIKCLTRFGKKSKTFIHERVWRDLRGAAGVADKFRLAER
jgi:hypothetical protein